MKRLIGLALVTAFLCGPAGEAVAGSEWGWSKVPILVTQLVPASGGMATRGTGVLVVTRKGQVALKIWGLEGASGPITDTGSLEIDLIVNGTVVNPSPSFPVQVSGGNADVTGALPVAPGDTFEIPGFRVLDSTGADLLRVGAKAKLRRFEVEGTISGLAGTCPDVTFVVEGITITANANTGYEEGACNDLADGVTVEVEGIVEPDGTHLATEVEFEEEN